MKLIKTANRYKRGEVKKDNNSIYIFTDNCDRTSGKFAIPDDSSYSKRFKKTGVCHPGVTSAVIRGLENAYPITTCKAYTTRHSLRLFKDEDFKEFKELVDKDFDEIKNACVEKGIDTIVFPMGGILNGKYSLITLERTPLLYWYIVKKEIELRDFEITKKE